MQDSLQIKLFEAIKRIYPNDFSYRKCKELLAQINEERMRLECREYKEDNMLRRLRELCEADETGYAPIEPVKNDKHYIVSYRYVPREPDLNMVADKSIFYKNLQGRLL